MQSAPKAAHAVVIGASTTGLISAAALARHFAKVTVLDRDTLPEAPEWRKGAPQSRHVHLLLSRGEQIFERYLPGLAHELKNAGGLTADMAGDTAWHYAGGWKSRFPSGIRMLCQSKGLLEWTLRNRAEAIPTIAVRGQAEMIGYTAEGSRITGVRLRGDEIIAADLIVDAGGRNSKTPTHLKDLGFGEVPVSEIPVDVGYATRAFVAPPGQRDWTSLIVHPRYPDTRLGVIIPVEDGRWLVTLVGSRGDHPPADDEGFLAFAKGLAVPDLYDAIRNAEPAGPIGLHRFASNLRRHYDTMARRPDRLAVVGDAACSFNPIYAQGMSQGATAAAILDETLTAWRARRGTALDGFTATFQKEYGHFADRCWFLSTTEEYRDSTVAGAPLWAGFINWYLEKFQELTWSDRDAAYRFLKVMHLLAPPMSLLSPLLALKVFAHALGGPARPIQGNGEKIHVA